MNYFKNIFFGSLLMMMCGVTSAQIGNPAPDFTVTDIDGQQHHLYDYLNAGRVVVIDFYYTTCGPCIYYSPQVNLAFEKYGCNTANTFFISIDYNDSNAEVQAYDNDYSIVFPSVSGLDGGGNSVVNQYGIIGFPALYVIDSSKMIIDQIDPPTLQVFDFRFQMHGIVPADCSVTAVNLTSQSLKAEIFPNPVATQDQLHVRIPDMNRGEAHFEIINCLGQQVQTGKLELNNAGSANLNADELIPGIYIIKINSLHNDKIYSGVFVKK